jgi:tetratricopeptide (TPR) repeat protein
VAIMDKQIEKEVRDIIERARAFFEQGKYDLALKSAQEAIENHINSEEPYTIISRSYFMMGDYDEAIESIANATLIYPNSLHLRWLNIRFLTMTENIDEAQALLNASLDDFNNHAQLAAEQVYLYGYAERDDLLEAAIRKYMERNPNDMDYRRYVAHNLVEIAQQCYVYDTAADMMLITEEASYNRCVKLLTTANSIYQDEYIQNELNYVLQFGELVYDADHNGLKLFYRIVGFILIGVAAYNLPAALDGENVSRTLTVAGIGILMQGLASLVKKISYRPYWKVYRDTYRGFKESDDGALYNILMLPWDMVKQIFDAFCN